MNALPSGYHPEYGMVTFNSQPLGCLEKLPLGVTASIRWLEILSHLLEIIP
jgi:hypothetical protein